MPELRSPAARPTLGVEGALVLAGVAIAAALADLGSIHQLEHGDSIVPVLVSLQRWTPMYWDQERYGMLVPLLALPFRDPLANLLVQRALLVAAGLLSVVLLARWALPERRAGLTGVVAAAALLVLLPAAWRFEFLGDQPYGLSLALCLAGLLLAEPEVDGRRTRWKLAAAALLCLAGHWVNAGAGFFLGPVSLARAAVGWLEGVSGPRVRARLGMDLALLALGLAAGQASIWLYPVVTGYRLRLDTGLFPPGRWPWALGRLLGNGLGESLRWCAAMGLLVPVGLLLSLARPRRSCEPLPPLASALLRTAALTSAALAYTLLTASLRWVGANDFHSRYLAPSLVLVHLAVLSMAIEPLGLLGERGAASGGPGPLTRWLRPAGVVALLAIPAAAVHAYGGPSLPGVRRDLEDRLGRWTEDILAARCDLVAGDYWSVWPAVWHATWVARHRGVPGPHGITHRTNPTARYWKQRPLAELRICRIRGVEAQSEYWLRAFHLWPVRLIEERRTVEVVSPDMAELESGR